jgi:hypothetical protein
MSIASPRRHSRTSSSMRARARIDLRLVVTPDRCRAHDSRRRRRPAPGCRARGPGLGLVSMQHRAAAIGARLSVRTRYEGGNRGAIGMPAGLAGNGETPLDRRSSRGRRARARRAPARRRRHSILSGDRRAARVSADKRLASRRACARSAAPSLRRIALTCALTADSRSAVHSRFAGRAGPSTASRRRETVGPSAARAPRRARAPPGRLPAPCWRSSPRARRTRRAVPTLRCGRSCRRRRTSTRSLAPRTPMHREPYARSSVAETRMTGNCGCAPRRCASAQKPWAPGRFKSSSKVGVRMLLERIEQPGNIVGLEETAVRADRRDRAGKRRTEQRMVVDDQEFIVHCRSVVPASSMRRASLRSVALCSTARFFGGSTTLVERVGTAVPPYDQGRISRQAQAALASGLA